MGDGNFLQAWTSPVRKDCNKIECGPTAVSGAAPERREAFFLSDEIDQVVLQAEHREFPDRSFVFSQQGLKVFLEGHSEVLAFAHGGQVCKLDL